VCSSDLGKDESVEGENVRNDMDHYWDYLSEDDQDWLRQFSASLYKLWEFHNEDGIIDYSSYGWEIVAWMKTNDPEPWNS